MRCEQARELFNAYLDGELSPTLETELAAHRLHCADCRRSLALLEVSGHIVASDREPVELHGDFTDRLVACVKTRNSKWTRFVRPGLYIGGPLAAAAVIALAFLGAFDRGAGKTQVAGETVEFISEMELGEALEAIEAGDATPQDLLTRIQSNLRTKRESGASLQQAMRLQLLRMLEAAERGTDQIQESEDDTRESSEADPTEPPGGPNP
ncbi:MAG: zf-HC2 domain-containing protein [Planctomycetes bacterium]|nr:zf-HC2 domain-containing protein [Planctomycetota bacterium]